MMLDECKMPLTQVICFCLFFLWAGERGGCIIVDSTRRGKRFPDSMSKTIPIWCCVLNRAIERYRLQTNNKVSGVDLDVVGVSASYSSTGTALCHSTLSLCAHLPHFKAFYCYSLILKFIQ